MEIQEVLNRRSDLSTFVVHLSRDTNNGSAADNLRSIVSERCLRAPTPMGWAKAQDDPDDEAKQTQRVACFSETPLEHIYSLFADISDRSIKLQPYGFAITKVVARMMGVNPVWYVDMTTRGGREWEEARALDELRDAATADSSFHSSALAKALPFFEQMGTWPQSQKEFWWEREWRHRGSVDLTSFWDKLIWLCPDAERPEFESFIRDNAPSASQSGVVCLDPSWGVEQIVARLCGLETCDVTLFHASVQRSKSDELVEALQPGPF